MAGCKNCTKKFQGRCDCCYLVDGIETIKEIVFCKTCDAYICKTCQGSWFKRSIAYFIKKLTNADPVTQPITDADTAQEKADWLDQRSEDFSFEQLEGDTSKQPGTDS